MGPLCRKGLSESVNVSFSLLIGVFNLFGESFPQKKFDTFWTEEKVDMAPVGFGSHDQEARTLS